MYGKGSYNVWQGLLQCMARALTMYGRDSYSAYLFRGSFDLSNSQSLTCHSVPISIVCVDKLFCIDLMNEQF